MCSKRNIRDFIKYSKFFYSSSILFKAIFFISFILKLKIQQIKTIEPKVVQIVKDFQIPLISIKKPKY